MTDNEKAATFVGWEPFAQASCDEWTDERGHVAPPDMSLPQHYMLALENIHAQGRLLPSITSEPTYWICEMENRKTGSLDVSITTQHGLASTVVAALAALYDAEHVRDATAGV